MEENWFLIKRLNLKPECCVSYKRQPYVSIMERNFRLTFDTNMVVRNYNLDLHYGGGSKFIVPPGTCIMEVKYNSFIPQWAIKIIQTNDCVQFKMSKFAKGLEKTRSLSII
ncbi:MAG: VTC domain-containing protein [Candidatus Lokiarchaeota archaeon]|nr:VTC domain-containing protein [Candidatus Lokiarchaeota archaeon]